MHAVLASPLAPLLYLVAACLVSAFNDPASDLPRFAKPLNNLTVSVGREAVFACIVENLGPYKVAWLRVDTQTILTISSHVITKNHRIAVTHSGHRTWSLHIRDTCETDRGWYMCQVNTDPMSSNTGFLEVVVPPDILDDSTSTDMMVNEGSNVTLRCAATGTPRPTITWRREAGGSISSQEAGGAMVSAEGSQLEITRVNRLHMGAYLCIASNGVPPTVSKRIVLIVHFSPMIHIENQLVGAYEGQKLTLECRSEAYPRPITYWTSPANETINNDGHYKVESSTSGYETKMKLVIKSVRTQDYGLFRCIATNSLGETDGKITLYSISRPNSVRKSNTRRDSKKFWSQEHGYEKTVAGTMEESSFRDNGDAEDDDLESSARCLLQPLLLLLGCCVTSSIIAQRLSS